MYVPREFAELRDEVLRGFIRDYPLALLVSSGLEVSHVPMILDGDLLRCHVARANPVWRSLADGGPVVAVFSVPSHYVSPSWYPSKAAHGRVVPTWNYTAVYVRGTASLFDGADELVTHLVEMVDEQEARFAEPWRVGDAPVEYLTGLTRGIVGVSIRVESMVGKFKLSQNRSEADRAGVIAGLEALGDRAADAVAALMRGLD
jgi:transcriptional regulator